METGMVAGGCLPEIDTTMEMGACRPTREAIMVLGGGWLLARIGYNHGSNSCWPAFVGWWLLARN